MHGGGALCPSAQVLVPADCSTDSAAHDNRCSDAISDVVRMLKATACSTHAHSVRWHAPQHRSTTCSVALQASLAKSSLTQPSPPLNAPHIPTHSHTPSTLQGFLFPYYHLNYWLGAIASPWPAFVWLDTTQPPPSLDTFQNWGTYLDARGSSQEPNNKEDSEFCAVANFTESTGTSWGWADITCGQKWPFICMIKREWRQLTGVTCLCCGYG